MAKKNPPDLNVSEVESLLSEVESLFLTDRKVYNPNRIVGCSSSTSTEAKACPCTTKSDTDWDEVDRLIKQFQFEDINPYSKSKNVSWARPKVVEDSGPPGREVSPSHKTTQPKDLVQCFPVYLSGSYEVKGLSKIGFEKPCSRLRCLKCDFDVESFDNFSWDESVDYLFLRNNMPDFERVSEKLNRARGVRAYACQCKSVSIGKLTNVQSHPQLRWICSKHLTVPA